MDHQWLSNSLSLQILMDFALLELQADVSKTGKNEESEESNNLKVDRSSWNCDSSLLSENSRKITLVIHTRTSFPCTIVDSFIVWQVHVLNSFSGSPLVVRIVPIALKSVSIGIVMHRRQSLIIICLTVSLRV